MESRTTIETLGFSLNNDEIKKEILYTSKDIFDFSLDLNIRLDLINNLEKEDEVIEVVNKLCSIYEQSKINSLRKNIIEIVTKSKIKDNFKLLLVFSLYNCNPSDIMVLNLFSELTNSESINVFQKINIIKILMNNENSLQNGLNKFTTTVLNSNLISSEQKFKAILSLETDIKEWIFVTSESILSFYKNENNNIRHRILSVQLLLSKCEKIVSEETKQNVFKFLLEISKNGKETLNTRADSTDLLLKYSKDEVLAEAKKIIKELGKTKEIGFYGNAQNVHTSEIAESVEKSIEKLQSYSILIVKNNSIDIEYVRNAIICFIDENKLHFNKEQIEISLNRISMDSAFYGRTNVTLKLLLLKTWSYIELHEFSFEIKKRLCEELELACDICSSGFLTAIINSLSTYGFEMKISWRDQIISNFSGRLNKKIRDMDNLRLQDFILEELTLDSSNHEGRKHLLKFLRENLLDIRDELYDEFKDHITDSDFDIYFRNAISEYETGSYI